LAFERDPRRKQDIRLQPFWDEIYHKTWGENILVARRQDWPIELEILDTQFGIDVIIELPTGHKLLGQEKSLSEDCASFRTITVAYKNVHTGRKLSWFHLASQFYSCGYEKTESGLTIGFDPWVIASWPMLVHHTALGNINWGDREQNDAKYTAIFKYTNMDNLPEDCIIASNLK